jgi:hypothetical protein
MSDTDAQIEAIQLANFRSFGKFMNKHGRDICPEPNAAGFYAGAWLTNARNLRADKKLLADGFEETFGTLMKNAYKVLDERNKIRKSLGLPKIQILNDVVRGIGKHPDILGTQGKDCNKRLKFTSLLGYANAAARKANALLPEKQLQKGIVWKTMSHWYAKGAKGEIHVMEGIMPDPDSKSFKDLNALKIFISTELPALLKNPDLADGARREAQALADKYVKLLERDEKAMTRDTSLAIRKLRSGCRPK